MKIVFLNWFSALPILNLLVSSPLRWSDHFKNYYLNGVNFLTILNRCILSMPGGESLKLDK
jgi:hypothetical protein